MATTASEYVARLQANTDAMYEGRVSFAAFSAAQRATWDEIQKNDRLDRAVLKALRDAR